MQPHAATAPQRPSRAVRGLPRQVLLAAGICLAASMLPAAAQVNRCTQADGRVLYTDGDCDKGEHQVEIESARTPEQVAADRLRAEEALLRQQELQRARQEELKLRAELQALELAKARQESQTRAYTPTAADYESSLACREARREVARRTESHGRYSSDGLQRLNDAKEAEYRACLGPEAYADIQRQRAVQPAPPVIVHQPVYAPRGHGWPQPYHPGSVIHVQPPGLHPPPRRPAPPDRPGPAGNAVKPPAEQEP